jgi:hypothetical protein
MSLALSINVFTAPEKAMVGERARPFGPLPAWDPITSTLIFGENDAVLVDTLPRQPKLKRWPVGLPCTIATSPRSISPTAISITLPG